MCVKKLSNPKKTTFKRKAFKVVRIAFGDFRSQWTPNSRGLQFDRAGTQITDTSNRGEDLRYVVGETQDFNGLGTYLFMREKDAYTSIANKTNFAILEVEIPKGTEYRTGEQIGFPVIIAKRAFIKDVIYEERQRFLRDPVTPPDLLKRNWVRAIS